MGRRGPQKLPLKLRVLNGRSDGRDSGGRALEKPLDLTESAPRMPSYLPDTAKRIWKQVVSELSGAGILKKVDGPSLEAYCIAVWQMREATKELEIHGSQSIDANGSLKQHPAVNTLRAARADIRAFAHEFGLTPASEANVSGKDEDDEQQGNPFAAGFG
ncbi:phage terminase small subunit P27 family [Bifidobacterium aquikefiri]|uniref:phage terminase small subunit P27 family n=1 Tax=Bifidobacterium aquikefiri TaxID=1653207 RepID=UPI0039EB247A